MWSLAVNKDIFSQWERKAKDLLWRCCSDMDHYLNKLCVFYTFKIFRSSFWGRNSLFFILCNSQRIWYQDAHVIDGLSRHLFCKNSPSSFSFALFSCKCNNTWYELQMGCHLHWAPQVWWGKGLPLAEEQVLLSVLGNLQGQKNPKGENFIFYHFL